MLHPGRRRQADLRAIGDALDHLRLRKVDLLGYHDGSSIAAELAVARPEQVRRVVMIGTPRDLPRVTQPVLVLRPKDELSDVTPRALAALPEAKIVDLAQHGRDLFDVAPEVALPRRREAAGAERKTA